MVTQQELRKQTIQSMQDRLKEQRKRELSQQKEPEVQRVQVQQEQVQYDNPVINQAVNKYGAENVAIALDNLNSKIEGGRSVIGTENPYVQEAYRYLIQSDPEIARAVESSSRYYAQSEYTKISPTTLPSKTEQSKVSNETPYERLMREANIKPVENKLGIKPVYDTSGKPIGYETPTKSVLVRPEKPLISKKGVNVPKITKNIIEYTVKTSNKILDRPISVFGGYKTPITYKKVLATPAYLLNLAGETTKEGWEDISKKAGIEKEKTIKETKFPLYQDVTYGGQDYLTIPEHQQVTFLSYVPSVVGMIPETAGYILAPYSLGISEIAYETEKLKDIDKTTKKEAEKQYEVYKNVQLTKEEIEQGYVKYSKDEYINLVTPQIKEQIKQQGYVSIGMNLGFLGVMGASDIFGKVTKQKFYKTGERIPEPETKFLEVRQPIIEGEKVTETAGFQMLTFQAPAEIKGYVSSPIREFFNFKPKVTFDWTQVTTPKEYLSKPVFDLVQEPYIMQLSRVKKGGELGKTKLFDIQGTTQNIEASQLSNLPRRLQYNIEQTFEKKITGVPTKIENIPKLVNKEDIFSIGNIQVTELFKLPRGKYPPTTTTLFETTSVSRVLKTSKEGEQLTNVITGFKEIKFKDVMVKRNIPIKEFSLKENKNALGFVERGSSTINLLENLPPKIRKKVIEHELGHIYSYEEGLTGLTKITKKESLKYIKNKYGGIIPKVYKRKGVIQEEYLADLNAGKVMDKSFNINVDVSRATGNIQTTKGLVLTRKPIDLTPEKSLGLTPANIVKTPLDRTFQLAQQKEILELIKPNINKLLPKTRVPKIVIKSTPREFPLMVGGLGIESQYAGTGQYELTTGGVSPINLLSVNEQNKVNFENLDLRTNQIEILKQPEILKVEQKNNQIFKTPQLELFKTPQKEIVKEILKTKQLEKQLTKQLTKQLSKQLTKQLQRQVPKQPEIIKTRTPLPPPPLFGSSKEELRKIAKGIKGEEFEVFTRKLGKDIFFKKATTVKEAGNILRKELSETLKASGFVTKKTGEKVSPSELGILGEEFGISKVNPFRIIQRKEKRLSRTPEVKEIHLFKKTKSKRLKFL